MMTLVYPWLLALALLPAAAYWLFPPLKEERRALVVPFYDLLAKQTGERGAKGSVIMRGVWYRNLLMFFSWLCLIAALARPQWIEPPVTKTIPMRDLLLAVDLSGSMATRDFTDAQGKKTDRLTAVKAVLDDFLSGRKGDRVGLIFFGSAAFVQAPFTEDVDVCRQLLEEAQPNMAGPQTAFGDALGLAIHVFDRSKVKERVLIVLTDGNDTASQIPPAKAARIARDKGIVIHTVAVGDPKAAGEDALDVEVLQNTAKITGGIYAFANDRNELGEIYKKLDAMQARKVQTITHHPKTDIYYWPLGMGLLLTFIQQSLLLLRGRRKGKDVAAMPFPRKREEALVSAP
jgi:Ca-activated chloride channel family protein